MRLIGHMGAADPEVASPSR